MPACFPHANACSNPDVGIELAAQGYDVMMTPGQAYYLDMVLGADWLESGAGWAGRVPPDQSYTYEAEGDFPSHLRPKCAVFKPVSGAKILRRSTGLMIWLFHVYVRWQKQVGRRLFGNEWSHEFCGHV